MRRGAGAVRSRTRQWSRTAFALAALFASFPLVARVLLGVWTFEGATGIAGMWLAIGVYLHIRSRRVKPAPDHPEIPLWAAGAPGSEGQTAKEVDEPPNQTHGYFKVTSVHTPSLTVYLPPAERATGAAMIIAPGGGHAFLNFDQEGTYVAEYL